MRKRSFTFTFLLFILSSPARSQKIWADSRAFKPEKPFKLHAFPFSPLQRQHVLASLQFLSVDVLLNHLPFFCAGELFIEKRLKVPFRFRLGSVQQVDWLEGKPLSIRPEYHQTQ
jgi:hypothetical protein